MIIDPNNMRFLNKNSLRKYYKNSRNSIEDPLFTGFTLTIDKLHSPLFYSCCSSLNTEDTLRSENGTPDLAQALETALTKMYKMHVIGVTDTYEINTLRAKDNLDDNRNAGYGLQDRYYMDNIIYGAVDYIYMVDKVTESTYTDDFGVADIGNGTPDTSIYDTYVQQNQEDIVFQSNVENLLRQEQLQQLGKAEFQVVGEDEDGNPIEELVLPDDYEDTTLDHQTAADRAVDGARIEAESLKNSAEHQANQTACDSAKYELTTAINGDESNPNKPGYKQKKKELENSQKEIDKQKSAVLKELDEFQFTIKGYFETLRGVGEKSVVKSNISETYKQFENFIKYFSKEKPSEREDGTEFNSTGTGNTKIQYSTKYSKINVSFKQPTDDDIKKEINKLKLDEEDLNKERQDKSYDNIFRISRTTIKSNVINSDADEDIRKLKSEVEQLEKDIYGVHPDGRIGTPEDPGYVNGEPSLALAYQQAKNTLENDACSNAEYRLAELEDVQKNIKDAYEFTDQQNQKNQVTRNPSFSMDNKKEGESNEAYGDRIRNSRTTKYEVPQTVYDMLGFINGMDDVINEHPYMLQSISGLEDAYKKYFEIQDPYMGSGDDKITIECLEFIDLKISSMFNKYFNAVYDRQYRRERVPINLRRFNCSVFVHDIRNFNTLTSSFSNGVTDLSVIAEIALHYISAIEFKFYDCEFVPDETGDIFEKVSNVDAGDMVKTKFTFKYGNCVINFLPFEDVKKYLLNNKEDKDIKPEVVKETVGSKQNDSDGPSGLIDDVVDDGNFRRWFDRSILGNVNNNDYREYIRHDSSVVVDDHFKTTIVNNFANGSVVNKNKELTKLDDELRRIVVGISASTGIPATGVADTLNIRYIGSILDETDKSAPVVKDLGNVTNSKIINTKRTEYIGNFTDTEEPEHKIVVDLGKIQ